MDKQERQVQVNRGKPVKVIAVSAGKGGVGKSNVSLNLAIALAQKKQQVLLMDADLGLANIDILVGLQATTNLSHVIQGSSRLQDILLTGPEGIRIIPAASGTQYMTHLSKAQHAGIIDAFNELTEAFDYMIIDTAAGLSDTVLSFARSAQEMIVVVCDEPACLTDAYALIKVMSQTYEWSHFHILANMVRHRHEGRTLFHTLDKVAGQFLNVKLDYLGVIPFDERVHDAVKQQKALVCAFPGSAAAIALQQVAAAVMQWTFTPTIGGNTSFFLERLVACDR